MLSTKKLIYKMLSKPIVVESGVGGSGNAWHYRKWSDGTAEAWARIQKTLTGVQSGAAPWSGYTYEIGTSNYPTNLFIEAPVGTISGSVGSAWCVVSYSQFYQQGISVVMTSNANGSQNCVARAYAIGRWK